MSEDGFELAIGGLRVRVRTDPGIDMEPGPPYLPFVVDADDEREPALEAIFRDAAPLPPLPRGPQRFASGDRLRFYEDAGCDGMVLVENCGETRTCETRISADGSRAEIRFAPWPPHKTSLYVMPRCFEHACIGAFARQKVMLVHAVGLAVPEGVLLPASTNFGKSTLAEMFDESETLSDERVALTLGDDGEPWIHGTPWRGTAARVSPRGVPLRALLFLGPHGKAPGVRPLKRAEAFQRLSFHGMTPLWDRTGMECCLDLAQAVSERVPVGELTYAPEAGPDPVRRAVEAFLA